MALTLTNNVSSLQAQNNLSTTTTSLSKSLERLSSGLKVNRGADGPAALVISERQRAQISGLKTAIDNTNKAVTLVQTGEGALNEMNSLLNKARSLALDSANAGVNDSNAFQANQSELTNILGTIDKIATSTEFNGKKLLDGTGSANTLSSSTVGASFAGSAAAKLSTSSYTLNVTTAAAKATVAGGAMPAATLVAADAGDITIGDGHSAVSVNLAAGDNIDSIVGKINTSLQKSGVTTITASNSSGQLSLTANDFTSDITVGGTAASLTAAGLTAGTSTHTDAVLNYTDSGSNTVNVTGKGNSFDLTGELAGVSLKLNGAANQTGAITANTNTGFTFQIGANAGQTATVDFDKMTTDSIGKVGANALSDAKIDSASSATTALGLIDKAISDVTNFRGKLGAFQSNTLMSTANNLKTTLENTTAAESIIRDTDFASEIANYTKLQTQMQAGSTVIGNANQMTQLVSQLLRG